MVIFIKYLLTGYIPCFQFYFMALDISALFQQSRKHGGCNSAEIKQQNITKKYKYPVYLVCLTLTINSLCDGNGLEAE